MVFCGSYVIMVLCLWGSLHHLFVQLVKHVSVDSAREGAYWIEFAIDSELRTLSIEFWEGTKFVCVPIVHNGRDVSPTMSYNDLM